MHEPPAQQPESRGGRVWVVLIVVAALATVAAPILYIASDAGERADAARLAALDKVRAATEKYKDIEVAKREGYHRTTECFESVDGDGGMGAHYQKDSLNDDDQIDLLHPEQLLYVPGKSGGSPQLAGVEYFAEFTGQRPPEIGFGRLDGPMPGHFPGQPKHYDIHVWVHRDNPDGTFNIWNPNVEC
jgi:hypothetical protein